MSRLLRPNVVTVADNPIAQVKCEPDRDEIDVEALLNEILVRFEFGLGTNFDLQFLTMDGERLLALRRYVVTKACENLSTSPTNFGQTMTKTLQYRECKPIGDWLIFDKVAKVLRNARDVEHYDLDNASPSALQQLMKEKTGKGFRPGTTRDDMVKAVQEIL